MSDGYIYSGGSEVPNTSAGASSISGYMSGYLIAADTYETETPFARVFRASVGVNPREYAREAPPVPAAAEERLYVL